LGHWLEMRALGQASGALDALAALLPDEADLVTGEGTRTVPISELTVGDVVLVRPGGWVPADGAIIEGEAELDESMVTGESRPVPKREGDRVVAGTVVTDSAVRAAAMLFYFAVGAGLITMTVWLALGEPDQAIRRTVTVLVIACPHALGLAIPLVIAIATGLAARNGILVKDRLALERMRTVDTVLFDKTGTLTKGEPTVSGVVAVDGDEDRLLRLAAAVEADSEHPLARAIVAAARTQAAGELPAAGDFRSMTGRGVQARVEDPPSRWAARCCCASWRWPSRRCWLTRSAPGSGAAPPSCMWSARTRSWACCRWRMRCGPSLARPWPSCTGWASG